MYYKRILTFMFPVLYSPYETVYFLGFFTSWIRIQEANLYADPCGSGSETLLYSILRFSTLMGTFKKFHYAPIFYEALIGKNVY